MADLSITVQALYFNLYTSGQQTVKLMTATQQVAVC